jgi:hypothetical protein
MFASCFLYKITLYSALTNEELVYMKQTWTRDRDRLKLASSKVGIVSDCCSSKVRTLGKGLNWQVPVGIVSASCSYKVMTLRTGSSWQALR